MYNILYKENLDSIINSYEEKIESLCQTIDIDQEIVEIEPKHNEKKSRQRVFLMACYIIVIIFIGVTAYPVVVRLIFFFIHIYINK